HGTQPLYRDPQEHPGKDRRRARKIPALIIGVLLFPAIYGKIRNTEEIRSRSKVKCNLTGGFSNGEAEI
ncbi:MAG: hypothetical protein SPJ28_01960, partial [Oscillospiraceae bacterium]|nr:hypothetical protein [Oscillospiraceae bacterium]